MSELKSRILNEPRQDREACLPLSRIVFAVDNIEAGCLPRYEREIGAVSCVIGARGAVPTKIYEALEVLVPVLQYASNPTWEYTKNMSEELENALCERSKKRAWDSLSKQEDIDTLRILQAVCPEDHFRTCDKNPLYNPKIFLKYFAEGIADLKEHELEPGYIIFPTRLFEYLSLVEHKLLYICKNDKTADPSGTILGGYYKDIPIIVNPNVPQDRVYITADPIYVGVFVDRSKEMEVSDIIDYPQKLRHGIVCSESIGMGCINDYAISCVSFSQFRSKSEVELRAEFRKKLTWWQRLLEDYYKKKMQRKLQKKTNKI